MKDRLPALIPCDAFRAGLAQAVETRQPADATIAFHGCRCSQAACRREYEDFVLLESAIRQWKSQTRSVSLAQRVVGQLSGSVAETEEIEVSRTGPTQTIIHRAPVRRREQRLAGLVLGGALCLVAVLLWRMPGGQPTVPLAQQIRDAESRVAKIEQLAPAAELEVVPSEPDTTFPVALWLDAATDRITSTVAMILPVDDDIAHIEAEPVEWSDRFRPLEETWRDWLQPADDGRTDHVQDGA